MPSPGGQISEMAGHEHCCGQAGLGRGCGIPSTSLWAPHGSPGAEPDDARTGCIEGCPRAAVWSGWRQIDEMPHESQRARSSAIPPSVEEPGRKLLTQNQVLGAVHAAG
jgi:hypothetical protein